MTDRGKQDDAQKAATSPGNEAIGKAKAVKGASVKTSSPKNVPEVHTSERGVVSQATPRPFIFALVEGERYVSYEAPRGFPKASSTQASRLK